MEPSARILAVDDQLYFRSFIEGILTELGYEAVTASSGEEALGLLATSGPFDVVVSDLVMPGMDGVETVSRVRERWPDQDIIVATGVGDVRTAVEALKRGAADYLIKPLEREDLARAISAVLERQQMRKDHARLLAENRAVKGRLVGFERALPMLGLTDPERIAAMLVEVLCAQARARSGVIWIRNAADGALERASAYGPVDLEQVSERWPGGSAPLEQQLREGRAVLVSVPRRAAARRAQTGALTGSGTATGATEGNLLVPCVRDGELRAIARLRGPIGGAFQERVLADCARVAELGAIALEHAELRGVGPPVQDPREAETVPGFFQSLGFLESVARTEIHKARRFGRQFSLVCFEVAPDGGGPAADVKARMAGLALGVLEETVRGTDLIASDAQQRLWVLAPEAGAISAVSMKRRLQARLEEVFANESLSVDLALGAATYPGDASSSEQLVATAQARVAEDRESLAAQLGLRPEQPVAELGAKLLERGSAMLPEGVRDVVSFLLRDIAARPADRDRLFLIPGSDEGAARAWCAGLPYGESSTEVLLGLDGETAPDSPHVQGVPLPDGIAANASWIVRIGESPAFGLVAGPTGDDGLRPVFQTADRRLVECLALGLERELGIGMEL